MAAFGLAVLIVVFAIGFASVGVFFARRLFRKRVGNSHNEVVNSLFSTAGMVYAVLLGFLVVVVWEAYDNAHRNVAEEAAALLPLYRLTYGMEAAHGAEARKLIRAYTVSVIRDEWPRMSHNGLGTPAARQAITELDRQFGRLTAAQKQSDAQVDEAFLSAKSDVVLDRSKRLFAATDKIPWVMWLGAIGGGILVMSMSFFIYMEDAWPHALMASLAASLIGLLLFIMVVLSRPFAGPLAIGPENFRAALYIMNELDRGS